LGKNIKGGLEGIVNNSAGRVALALAVQTFPLTEAQGEHAIENDLNRVWKPVGSLLAQANRRDLRAAGVINKLSKEGKIAEADSYMAKLGLSTKIETEANPAQHEKNRFKKTGRTLKPTNNILLYDRAKVETYGQQHPMKRIGLAAHGWVQASRAVRKRRSSDVLGSANQSAQRLPPFKDKPKDIPHVNGTATPTGTADNPVVTITNSFPGIRSVMPSRGIETALAYEKNNMRLQMKAIIRKEAKRLRGGK
jgi:hypothetical protein